MEPITAAPIFPGTWGVFFAGDDGYDDTGDCSTSSSSYTTSSSSSSYDSFSIFK